MQPGRKIGTLRLSEVMRQRDPIERRALAALHDGAAKPWLEWAREHNRVELATGAKLLDRAVSEWHAGTIRHGLPDAVLIARDNDTRHGLNDRARELVRQQGGLGPDHAYGPRHVAVGDRVICRRNDRQADVDNGTRGTVRVADDTGVLIQTDAGSMRRLAAYHVSEHVEHAYALTGHGMQGGTVECAIVVAAPHELTKGWSYTALSRACGLTRLYVISDSHDRERDGLAPGERQDRLTDKELYARLQRYMQTRDDEDLAIEQLSSPSVPVPAREPLGKALVALDSGEPAFGRAEQPAPGGTSTESFRAANEQAAALQVRLDALKIPEVKRLEAAERREQELIEHKADLLERLRQIPPGPKLAFARDSQSEERQNVQRALGAVDVELAGVRTLRRHVVDEVGDVDQIRVERDAIERALASAVGQRDRLGHALIAQELSTRPRWATMALGEPPETARERALWDRAARGLARYRLEHDVTDGTLALGERPVDPRRIERYEQARAQLERVRCELGLHSREEEPAQPVRLPTEYVRLFGQTRTAALEQALAVASEQARTTMDEQLLASNSTGRAIADLDRRAAGRAIRLEQEHAHHKETAQKQADRATELEARAATLGWRDRRERELLRHDAAHHRRHAERHGSDVDRIELELHRLHAAGRHPDQWLQSHGADLVAQLAAGAELEHRREQRIAREVERAVIRPAEHVRDAVGDRPLDDPELAEQWERLARRVERHRLTYEFDVDRDGSLGPDPSQVRKDHRRAYEEAHSSLAEDIARYRESRDLPPFERARNITLDDDEHALGRSM
jgi:hypothetical protein